jgi:DNA uptake protein ComE-like DNA-binding protein
MTYKSKFAAFTLCTAIGMAACAAPSALAQQNNVPGVGTVVKKKPGNSPIVAPSDKNGEVRITGLAPGEYTVRVFDGAEETAMRVGRDGKLSFVTRENYTKPDPNASDPRARRALPVLRRWAEPIPFYIGKAGASGEADTPNLSSDPAVIAKRKKGLILARTATAQPDGGGTQSLPAGAVVLDMKAQFTMTPPSPCAFPPPGTKSTCFGPRPQGHIDVNSSIAREINRIAPSTGIEAASAIVSEREKNGVYKDATDFARRICTVTSIDFDDASIRMGDTTIIMPRGGDPKASGFKCAPQDNMVRLFHSWHAYVGHVTLLR